MMCATSDSGVNDSPSDYGFQDSRVKVLAMLKIQGSRVKRRLRRDSIFKRLIDTYGGRGRVVVGGWSKIH